MLLTAAKLAAELGCSRNTVDAYARAGMPAAGAKPRTYDPVIVRRWMAQHIDPGKLHGGNRPKAGRKKPSPSKQPRAKDQEDTPTTKPGRRRRPPGLEVQGGIDFDAAKAAKGEAGEQAKEEPKDGPRDGSCDTIPTNVEELQKLAESGKLTRTAIAMAVEAIKLRKAMREEDEEAGKLVATAIVETAWTRGVQALRAAIEQLPAAIAARAQGGLSLTGPQVGELRRLLVEQCEAAMRGMVEAAEAAMAQE